MKELSIPLLAAFFYGVKPIFAKAGLRLSNEPLLGAAIGILTSLVVHTVFFCNFAGDRSPAKVIPQRSRVFLRCRVTFYVGYFLSFPCYAVSAGVDSCALDGDRTPCHTWFELYCFA